VVGGLSDRYGRRPVLLASLLGLGCDYIFLALAPSSACPTPRCSRCRPLTARFLKNIITQKSPLPVRRGLFYGRFP
jgi:MFS family permease